MEMVLVYDVVRHTGGWAVAQGDTKLSSYRSQEEAIAQARLLGHDAFDRGETCAVRVQTFAGAFRTECTYGVDGPESSFRGGRF